MIKLLKLIMNKREHLVKFTNISAEESILLNILTALKRERILRKS